MAHFKAFLYDTLVNVMASLLLDLLHLVSTWWDQLRLVRPSFHRRCVG